MLHKGNLTLLIDTKRGQPLLFYTIMKDYILKKIKY